MFLTRLLCVAIICFSSAIGELCFEDEVCLTRGAKELYALYVPGPADNSLDPIRLDFIDGDVKTLKLKLFNATLSGLKNCNVDVLRLSIKDAKYEYNIACPLLVLESGYEMKGDIGPMFVEGKGTCKVDHYDYHLHYSGNYGKTEKDGKLYLEAKNHNLEIKAKGKVHYDFKNLYNGDKVKSDAMHKYANENWETVDKIVRQPTLEAFSHVLFKHLNAYMKENSADVHFTKKT